LCKTGAAYGDKVAKPSDPTKAGYTFDGWYADSALSTAWDFANDAVVGNTTLYAKWAQLPPNVVTNGGSGAVLDVPKSETVVNVS